MRNTLVWALVIIGSLLVALGAVLVAWQTVLATRTEQAARKKPGRGFDAGADISAVLEAIGKLPPGDRLIAYGIVALGLAGFINGDLAVSVGDGEKTG